MSSFTRTDRSHLAHWWWTVDRWSLVALGSLMGFGALLVLAASPAAAGRIGLQAFQLASRQLVLLPAAVAIIFALSLTNPRFVRRLATIGLLVATLLLVATHFYGMEIKGASRWLAIFGLSLQPSEFVKPFFAVFAAWMFAAAAEGEEIPGRLIATMTWAILTALLLAQPDVGQAFLLSAVWAGQFFLAGLALYWVALIALLPVVGLTVAYLTLPHVTKRIDAFLDPASGDRYQVDRSLEAFANGGLLGRGPGEGTVKGQLPDVHSDFIFAVAGEELGILACLMIVALFAFIVLRGFARLLRETDLFVMLAVSGLLVQFGLQALINMASTLNLMPTKGMTLPFISYGGSSLLALALAMGMLLALTRRRPTLEVPT